MDRGKFELGGIVGFLSLLPWGKIIELAVGLIGRWLKHSDDMKELEQEWLKFIRSLDKQLPVKFSEEQKIALKKLEEKERQEKSKTDHIKNQAETYKAKHQEIYQKYLKLEDENQKKNA